MIFFLMNIVFLCIVNVSLTLVGTISNLVVVSSIWKSAQMRKKTCYFMIFVLSCFDLSVILVNHPLVIGLAIAVAFGEVDREMIDFYLGWSHLLLAFSSLALLTMNIERYLAITYPIFHRNKVTRRKLMVLLASFQLFALALQILSIRGTFIAVKHCYITLMVVFSPPMLFTNFKLFIMARKMQLRNPQTGDKRRADLKKISSCLLAVVCFLIFSVIPGVVFTSLMPLWSVGLMKKHALTLWLWIRTVICMNATLNCFVFYWNNNILRDRGKKLLQRYLKLEL